jgi:hypothetical protein
MDVANGAQGVNTYLGHSCASTPPKMLFRGPDLRADGGDSSGCPQSGGEREEL